MEWNNELCLELIDEYKKWPILWNAKHPSHFSRNQKADAWEAIATNLKITVADAKQKMNSLLGSLRRERSKGKKIIETGNATSEAYVSKWYAFKRMRFLLNRDAPVTTMDTELEARGDEKWEVSELQSSFEENSNSTPESEVSQISMQEIQESQEQESTEKVFASKGKRVVPSLDMPKHKKRKCSKNDATNLEALFTILKQLVAVPAADSCATYGAHVGNKLRNYDQQVRVQVEHAINNILYDADMGKYNSPNLR